jgi:hypothetical protein
MSTNAGVCLAALFPLSLSCVALGCSSESNEATPRDGGGGVVMLASEAAAAVDAPGGTDAPAADAPAADAGLIEIDRSHLADASIDNPLDYSDPALWVCRPGIDPNPCYGNHGELDATEVLDDGGLQLVRHHHAESPKFDCFYVYPTVYLVGNGNNWTNLSDISNVLDALMAQGARMSRICEVYAPLYRQVAIAPNLVVPGDAGASGPTGEGGTGEGGTDATAPDSTAPGANTGDASGANSGSGPLSGPGFMNAAADVNAAFKYYLDHFNKGRKFVLMGHSQGSGMLINVMQTQIDNSDQLRSQLISALIIGGGVTVAQGQTTGGSFQHIPICTSPDETGCTIAYSSFDTNGPDSTSIFGRATGGQQVACTNPGPLAGNLGPYKGSYFHLLINNPLFLPMVKPTVGADAGAAFLLYRDVFTGNCVNKNGANYLEITSAIQDAGDPRGLPPYNSLPGFGLHVYDWHFPMDDLIDLVSQQAAAALP